MPWPSQSDSLGLAEGAVTPVRGAPLAPVSFDSNFDRGQRPSRGQRSSSRPWADRRQSQCHEHEEQERERNSERNSEGPQRMMSVMDLWRSTCVFFGAISRRPIEDQPILGWDRYRHFGLWDSYVVPFRLRHGPGTGATRGGRWAGRTSRAPRGAARARWGIGVYGSAKPTVRAPVAFIISCLQGWLVRGLLTLVHMSSESNGRALACGSGRATVHTHSCKRYGLYCEQALEVGLSARSRPRVRSQARRR